MALVPKDYYLNLDWCVLTEKAEIPLLVSNAVDAARRRNYLVDSVLEPLFEAMLALDADLGFQWQLALCNRPEGPDADVARDLIRVWRTRDELPRPVLEQVLRWSEDEMAFRQWPAVIEESDRLLRAHAMRRLIEALPQGHLRVELSHIRHDKRLARWLRRAIDAMGTSIDFFVSQSEREGDAEWQQNALFRELLHLDQLLPPLLLSSDLLLLQPTGSFDFAMAVFGFTSVNEQTWEHALEEQSKLIIRRMFLNDLKANRSPVPTIIRLCFGNEELEGTVLHELDYVTRTFDSVGQREIVIDKLSGVYSSFRKQPLLNTEIGRRYRRMMRVLHEDNLRRLLTSDQVDELNRRNPVLTDLATIASESRRFLTMRRALDRSTSEIIAADMDFTQSIRTLRASYIRRLLEL